MAKFVRWLGAFGHGNSLAECAAWETKQTARQVAAEPLIRGKSKIHHAKIGLVVAHPEATFARGWLYDAYTVEKINGVLMATRQRNNEFKSMDRFLAALSKQGGRMAHAEASFNAPLYSAVAVKKCASLRGKRRADRLAAMLDLPLVIL